MKPNKKIILSLLIFIGVLFTVSSCNDDNSCEYDKKFCDQLQLNVGDPCDTNDDGSNDGRVSEDCECLVV